MDNASEIFKNRLRSLLATNSPLKTKVCKMTGISRSGMDSYLEGGVVPGLENADKIARALGLTLAEFLEGERPAEVTIISDHPLEECARRVHEAVKRLKDRQPENPENDANT